MFNRNQPPLTVIVTSERWDAVDAPTPRNIWLTQVLQQMGGVNESVAPGTYHFNVKRKGLKMVASLDPAQ